MKKVVVLCIVWFVIVGCASMPQYGPNLASYTKEQRQAYDAWRSIDMKNLREDQQETLANLKGEVLSGLDLAAYPWMDPNCLTNRDKVFLGDLMGAILATHVTNSNR